MKKLFLLVTIMLSFSAFASTNLTPEGKTAQYFESIKNNPKKLAAFLLAMPKGGDIHNHIGGASYAENLLNDAKHDSFCVNPTTYTAYLNDHCSLHNLLTTAIQNPAFKNQLIDAWSIRHFKPTTPISGHDHFFAAFEKFSALQNNHRSEVLAEIATRAAQQNELYLELMATPDDNASGALGSKIGWDSNLEAMRHKLLAANFNKIITMISNNTTIDEHGMQRLLACNTNHPNAACNITIRYQYQVFRNQAPESVFAQLLAGFEAAKNDKRIVGINMVQPEDGSIAMRDYKLHMTMVQFLRKQYPGVKVSQHAGELNKAFVPAEGLTFPIHDAIHTAGADRIGHGVDITHEKNARQLISFMANHHKLVEINLSNNDLF